MNKIRFMLKNWRTGIHLLFMRCFFLHRLPKIKFMLKNWKTGIHLLFRTKRFGVNNRWWVDFDSPFGWPWYKKLTLIFAFPIINNYIGMWFRAVACHFMTDEEKRAFGWLK
jgi:hypothetical protein